MGFGGSLLLRHTGGILHRIPQKGAYCLAGVPSVVGSGRPAGKEREVRIVRTGGGRAAGVLRISDTMNCSPPVYMGDFRYHPSTAPVLKAANESRSLGILAHPGDSSDLDDVAPVRSEATCLSGRFP